MAEQPLVMGIVNMTPDSFYDGSRFTLTDDILRQAEKMLAAGADIVDIGAQSTRPQATLLSADEELSRLSGIITALTGHFPEIVVSVDTFYSRVARECVDAGASMVNDISGGGMDESMLETVATLDVPFVCMHMRGTPQTMMQHTHYDDLITDVLDYFVARCEACRIAGIRDVIIDPGFGFSKNRQHNFELLGKLGVLKLTGRPLMVGLSRKSTIYKTLGVTAAEALNGTTVMNTIALMNGADILRVHDVREAKECIRLFGAYHNV